MYTDETYNEILSELLSYVPDNIDKRVSSPVYMFLSAVARKCAEKNVRINDLEKLTVLETSKGEYLDRIGKPEGVQRNSAAASIRRVTFKPEEISLPIGTRFFTKDGLFWNLITSNTVQCDTTGTTGNNTSNGENLVPTENISLQSAVLGEIVVRGTEVEDDDNYRERITAESTNTKNNSNKAQIISWVKEIQGVGDAKVKSLWNGPNTVKVIICNDNMEPADAELVNKVQDVLDPMEKQGEGEGLADIGTVVTVVSAIKMDVNINVRLSTTLELSIAKQKIEEVIKNYLKKEAFSSNTIIYNVIGSLILNIEGIYDYSDMTINGETGNIDVPEDKIAILNDLEVLI